MVIVQLIMLMMTFVLLKSLVRNASPAFSLLLSLMLAIFFTIQLSSVILTGNIADYRFYENFDLADVVSVAGFFGIQGLLIFLGLIIAMLCIHYFGYFLVRHGVKRWAIASSFMVCILFMFFPGGILFNAYETVRLKLTGDASFHEALASLNITEEDYVLKEGLSATPGKNIVVLSLESLELGFLRERLNHLTPNLSQLAKDNKMYTMLQCPAGGWTSASMYTALTGVPAYFGTHGNSVFQNSAEHRLTTLPDVLKNAGYDLKYFIGKKEYSGINDMLGVFGFTVKSEKDFEDIYEEVPWGMQDMDLFEEFKKDLLRSKKSETPFAYFLSTIGTHFPDGVPDIRIDSLLPPQKSRLELMVSATDYFIGQLVDFLREEEMLANTVFFIYPDHLLMGTNARALEDIDERSLYLITNADPDRLPFSPSEVIYQIDIPKLILAGAEIKHNATFLTDYIPKKNKIEFLRANDRQLLQLNDASLRTYNIREGFYVELDEEKSTFELKNIEDVVLASHPLPQQGYGQRIFLESDIRPVSNSTFDLTKPSPPINTPYYIDLFWSDENIYVSLKGQQGYGILKSGNREVSFNSEEIKIITDLRISEQIELSEDKIRLESNSWNAKKASNFSIGKEKHLVTRGLTLVSFYSPQRWEYKTFDTYGSPEDTRALLSNLTQLTKNKGKFCILAHDSAAKHLAGISAELERLGLEKLAGLKEREAYLMENLTTGTIRELTAPNSLTLTLEYPENVQKTNPLFAKKKIDFTYNANRYIAHAGGSIDGIKYTNSLESLDQSYKEGFRYIELDIIETSDGHYVAAHDWKHWARETNYKGEIPVTLAEFKKHKIRGKYSTLDMDGISKWFASHPDAILVTDKVNEPGKFVSKFKDNNRLWMELFSLKALEEAKENKVTAMISEGLLPKLGDSIIPFMVRHGISHATISRRNIEKNTELLRKFNEHNIKAYVYHVNFDQGKDEQYVYDNELGLVYGMYADNWIPAFSKKGEE